MGKSMNGPDGTDVAMLMSAIGQLHGCEVVMTVTAGIQGHNGSLEVMAEARFTVLPGSSLPRVISTTEIWPNRKHNTLLGLMYNAVWQLDYAIGQAYEQMSLLQKA